MKQRPLSTQAMRDGAMVGAALVASFVGAHRFDLFERFSSWSARHEYLQAGELAIVSVAIVAGLAWFAVRRWTEARHALAERDRFLEAVAHRLRTPLSSVMGYSLLLRDEPESTRAEDLRWMVEEVAMRSVEASDLLDDMLVAAHVEHGSLELLTAPVDLSDETEWVLRNYPSDAPIDVDYLGTRCWASADPVRVRQILRILIANARAYGGEKVRIEVDTSGPAVRVTVADDGPGLPPGNEEQAFRAFATASDQSEWTFPMGIGLGIARQLAEKMGGSIRYRRRLTWTCFDFFIPKADAAAFVYEMPTAVEILDPAPAAMAG